MKKIKQFAAILMVCVALTSCYQTKFAVGTGATGTTEVKAKNHFLIAGLAPVGKQADPATMAGSANYNVKVYFTFVDMLVSGITCGIYTPCTVVVTK